MRVRFDTHVHLWRPGDGHRVLIRERIPELDADHSLAAVRPLLAAAGVGRILLVSAAQEEAETESLLAAAEGARDLVAGVVGWLDLEAPAIEARIRSFAARPAWLGIRLPLTVMADRNFIGRARVTRAIAALAEAGALIEVLAAPDQLGLAARVLAEHPAARIILDHAGNPDTGAAPSREWVAGLQAFARLPGAVCKVSAFWVPGDPAPSVERAAPFFAAVVDAFGPSRMVAAANWPVTSLAGDYAAPWHRLEALADGAGLGAGDWAAIAATNAERLTNAVRADGVGAGEGRS